MQKQHRLKKKTESNLTERAEGSDIEFPGKQEERGVLTAWYIISSVFLAAAVGLCMFISVQVAANGYANIAGFSMFRVVTGSMEPTISVGEALICRSVAIEDIEVGDIVCYRTEVAEIRGAVVTHRVVAVETDENGSLYLMTRGDSNIVADPYPVREDDLVGQVIWYSGKESVVTNVLSFLTGKIGFLTCIVFPVLLAAGLILQSSVKNLHQEVLRVKRELDREEDLHPSREDGAENEAREESAQSGMAPMPGYTVLTQADYDEILEAVRAELIEELQNYVTPDT